MMFISDNDPSIVGDPAEGLIDCISSPVAIPESVILSINVPVVLAIRNQKVDTSLSQTFSSWIAVVGLVSDHSPWSGPWSSWSPFEDSDFSNNLVKEVDLSWRGRVGMAPERNTLAIDRYQALCSLPSLGGPDYRAPFLREKSSYPKYFIPFEDAVVVQLGGKSPPRVVEHVGFIPLSQSTLAC